MDREKQIKGALHDLGTINGSTYKDIGLKWGIPLSTLRERHKSITHSRTTAREQQQVLTHAQEQGVVHWITGLTKKGFPPTHKLLRARIEDIIKMFNPDASSLGKNYITRFLRRHKELGSAFANRRDKKRVIPHAKEVYRDFFTKVSSLGLVFLVVAYSLLVAENNPRTSHIASKHL